MRGRKKRAADFTSRLMRFRIGGLRSGPGSRWLAAFAGSRREESPGSRGQGGG